MPELSRFLTDLMSGAAVSSEEPHVSAREQAALDAKIVLGELSARGGDLGSAAESFLARFSHSPFDLSTSPWIVQARTYLSLPEGAARTMLESDLIRMTRRLDGQAAACERLSTETDLGAIVADRAFQVELPGYGIMDRGVIRAERVPPDAYLPDFDETFEGSVRIERSKAFIFFGRSKKEDPVPNESEFASGYLANGEAAFTTNVRFIHGMWPGSVSDGRLRVRTSEASILWTALPRSANIPEGPVLVEREDSVLHIREPGSGNLIDTINVPSAAKAHIATSPGVPVEVSATEDFTVLVAVGHAHQAVKSVVAQTMQLVGHAISDQVKLEDFGNVSIIFLESNPDAPAGSIRLPNYSKGQSLDYPEIIVDLGALERDPIRAAAEISHQLGRLEHYRRLREGIPDVANPPEPPVDLFIPADMNTAARFAAEHISGIEGRLRFFLRSIAKGTLLPMEIADQCAELRGIFEAFDDEKFMGAFSPQMAATVARVRGLGAMVSIMITDNVELDAPEAVRGYLLEESGTTKRYRPQGDFRFDLMTKTYMDLVSHPIEPALRTTREEAAGRSMSIAVRSEAASANSLALITHGLEEPDSRIGDLIRQRAENLLILEQYEEREDPHFYTRDALSDAESLHRAESIQFVMSTVGGLFDELDNAFHGPTYTDDRDDYDDDRDTRLSGFSEVDFFKEFADLEPDAGLDWNTDPLAFETGRDSLSESPISPEEAERLRQLVIARDVKGFKRTVLAIAEERSIGMVDDDAIELFGRLLEGLSDVTSNIKSQTDQNADLSERIGGWVYAMTGLEGKRATDLVDLMMGDLRSIHLTDHQITVRISQRLSHVIEGGARGIAERFITVAAEDEPRWGDINLGRVVPGPLMRDAGKALVKRDGVEVSKLMHFFSEEGDTLDDVRPDLNDEVARRKFYLMEDCGFIAAMPPVTDATKSKMGEPLLETAGELRPEIEEFIGADFINDGVLRIRRDRVGQGEDLPAQQTASPDPAADIRQILGGVFEHIGLHRTVYMLVDQMDAAFTLRHSRQGARDNLEVRTPRERALKNLFIIHSALEKEGINPDQIEVVDARRQLGQAPARMLPSAPPEPTDTTSA